MHDEGYRSFCPFHTRTPRGQGRARDGSVGAASSKRAPVGVFVKIRKDQEEIPL